MYNHNPAARPSWRDFMTMKTHHWITALAVVMFVGLSAHGKEPKREPKKKKPTAEVKVEARTRLWSSRRG